MIDNPTQSYTFMLILPKDVIKSKLDKVKDTMTSQIQSQFVLPFMVLMIILIGFISYFIDKLAD